MGNRFSDYEAGKMSAFDSAMLMIDDLAVKNRDLEQENWDLKLALWHAHAMANILAVCPIEQCDWCRLGVKINMEIRKVITE